MSGINSSSSRFSLLSLLSITLHPPRHHPRIRLIAVLDANDAIRSGNADTTKLRVPDARLLSAKAFLYSKLLLSTLSADRLRFVFSFSV
uniref:Secreted protein n=1 Tax=Caenorhabditis tropicalis TaxID=1561998 RepID=A0A1I7SXE9_9PELO